MVVIQRALAADELDQARRIALDHRLAHIDPIGLGQLLALVRAPSHQRLQRAQGHAGQLVGDLAALPRIEGGWVVDAKLRERLLDLGLLRQRQLHALDPRIVGHQRMQVVQVVGDQQADEGQLGEGGFAGPVADQAGEAGGLEVAGAIGRQELVGAAHKHRDGLGLATAQRAQVAAVAQIAADQLDRRARVMAHCGKLRRARPGLETLAAAQGRQPVARIEDEHQREALQQARVEVLDHADQAAIQHEAIGDIAVQDELAVGAAFVGELEGLGPGRKDGRVRAQGRGLPVLAACGRSVG